MWSLFLVGCDWFSVGGTGPGVPTTTLSPILPTAMTGQDTASVPSPVEPAPDLSGPWTAVGACGGLRMLATNGAANLIVGIDLQSSAFEGLSKGKTWTETLTVGGQASLGVYVGAASWDLLCGSLEEFPGDYDPRWAAPNGASFTVELVPDAPFGDDDYAVRELGTLMLRTDTPIELPAASGDAAGKAVLPAIEIQVRWGFFDLPA
ncbi:MAG: hypothetical protein AAGA48_37195 [Myxococcota bacterium]